MKLRNEIVIIAILSILISFFSTMAYRTKKNKESAEESCQIVTGTPIYLAVGESYVFESIVSYGSAGFHRKNTGNPVDFRCFCLYQRGIAGQASSFLMICRGQTSAQ